MNNKKKLLFKEKTIYFKKTKIIKVNDIRFPVPKSSIIGNYSTKKAP